jgi:hypothetical protein
MKKLAEENHQGGKLSRNKRISKVGMQLPLSLKKKLFNQCVLPAMTNGCETWISTKKLSQNLLVAQRAMERSMLNVTKRDRKNNE